jgi:hypothetical protein
MKELLPEIVILALNTDTVPKELSFLQAHGFSPIHVQGVYKGTSEDSYLVPIKGTEELERLKVIALQHGQESILYADEARVAKLLYLTTGEQVPLGTLQPIGEIEALNSLSYTYVPETNTYWGTK